MSKVFGKVVLVSTLIAGAAVGSLAYLKKEGIIGGSDSVAKDIADKVSSDAADLIAKERNYVDLGTAAEAPAAEEKAEEAAAEEEAADAEAEAPEAEDTFEPGIKAENIKAADVNTIGSSVSEEFFNDEEK